VSERYDTIGRGYAHRRREDPRIAQAIRRALGPARSVVNVGAGAGNYEPHDLRVIAVEPSQVMIDQRPLGRSALLGRAEALPLADSSVDAAMTVLSLHHWSDRGAGLRELQRVARQRIVIVTIDPVVSNRTWLMDHYLADYKDVDLRILPPPAELAQQLGGHVETLPIPADCTDGFTLSFWAHPERVLDPDARAATSGLALMPTDTIDRLVDQLSHDLRSGEWDRRWGHLRSLHEFDAGLRLVVADTAANMPPPHPVAP
jgi:SAM-dependent methyltransferase